MIERGIGNIYDEATTAAYYDRKKGKLNPEAILESDLYFINLLPESLKGKRVLDLGCGDGRHSQMFSNLGAGEVIGLDLSTDMVVEAQKRKSKRKLTRFTIKQGDIRDVASIFKDSRFDMIFSRFSLPYVQDLEKTMQGVAAVLSPNGELYALTSTVTIKNSNFIDEIRGSIIPIDLMIGGNPVPLKNHAYAIEDYNKAMRNAGLEVTDQRTFPARDASISSDYQFKEQIDFNYTVLKARKQ